MEDQAPPEACIDKFRQGLWNREQLDRPPVGIAAGRTRLPINYLRKFFPRAEVLSVEGGRRLVRTDYEDPFWLHFSS